jgi:hypothetical protein
MPKLNAILPPLALLLSLCWLTACVTKKFIGAPANSTNSENTWTSIQLPLPLPGSLEVSWHSKANPQCRKGIPTKQRS